MDTFVPPRNPSFFSELTETPKVIRAEFDDGYTQRASDGIHPTKQQWKLAWNNVKPDDATTLLTFFRAKKGAESFYYTIPGEAEAQIWTCTTWTQTFNEYNNSNIVATFQEEVDPD